MLALKFTPFLYLLPKAKKEKIMFQNKVNLIVSGLLFFFSSCASDGIDVTSIGDGNSGTGGSLARFMIAGDFMYLVDNERIKTLDVSTPADPTQIDEQKIATGIESIFRLGERLFIGSSSGLFLYTIGADGKPVRQGEWLYSNFDFPIYPCDPVVSNDSIAFVTLNSTIIVEGCRREVPVSVNQLNIFDVKDIQNPQLLAQHDMDDPQGVGINGDLLFLCENEFGLKIFDISDPLNLELVAHLTNVDAHDVIPLDGLLLLVGESNVYEVDYSDRADIRVISIIPVGA